MPEEMRAMTDTRARTRMVEPRQSSPLAQGPARLEGYSLETLEAILAPGPFDVSSGEPSAQDNDWSFVN